MNSRKEKVKELTDKLKEGVRDVFESGRYEEYLKVMSRFHNYSPRNSVLIAMQKPDASLVAGFQSWKKNFGRYVKQGEKAIEILAPMKLKLTKENEDGTLLNPDEEELVYTAFRTAYVFDVSQTEGKDLPEIVANLTGNVENFDQFMEALRETSPVPIELKKLSTVDGFYKIEDKEIVVNSNMSEPQIMAATIHEIAHAMLHNNDKNSPHYEDNLKKGRMTREIEAESIAYVVCQYFGIETGENSFGYVASWSKNKELSDLFSSLDTIKEGAGKIINDVEKHFAKDDKYVQKSELSKVCEPSFYLPGNQDFVR